MKKNYRVTSGQHGIPAYVLERFAIEGKTLAVCDHEARKKFVPLVLAKENAGNDLALYRVDVEEVTTHITTSQPIRRGAGMKK